ncbi:response regulator [Nostoc sp. CENA67]|uniref:histidine kinase n=1 Tax=Amazonocrinis nigriterrae CENA67 TaxID=2794033 RepID=A0A8J7HQL3_9NOST|nr:response regulator [Amazonocrinis nigriterrae]MBH8563632.1 response regulator [Amazonocrinis nigriterrae CENA67]
MLPEQQQRILGYFIEEARDHLNTIEQGLLNLESTLNDPEMVNEVFRAAHSIKGGAAMLGLTSIQQTSHRLEDCFKVLKEHPVQIDQKLESLFLGVSDTLKSLLEHLSGPFGLSEEAASTLMSEAEPVFKWLNEHLDILVKQGTSGSESTVTQIQPFPGDSVNTLTEIFLRPDNLTLGEDTSTEIPSSVVSQATGSPATARENLNAGEFQTQVLQALREMLQSFKQKTTPESRQNLQQSCQQLVKLGDTWNLSNWCSLCQAAANAIANPDNTYLTLAKIVITEIKQAQELVLQGREAEIAISQQLEGLLTFPEIDLLTITTDLLDERLAIITEPPTELAPTSHQDHINNNATVVQPTDSVISLTEISEQLHIDVATQNAVTGDVPANLLFGSEDDAFILSRSTDQHGPEVGLAELNTLADLFEGETPELDETWQQEEVLDINGVSKLGIELKKSNIEDADSDLADFLSLDEDRNSNGSQISPTTTEDLNLLFGDNFLEKDNFEPQNLPTSAAIPGELLEEFTEISSESQQSLEIQPKDVIGDLLSIALDENDTLSVREVTQPETKVVTSSELSTNQQSSFDELFIETANAGSFEEITFSNDQELKSTISQPDALSVGNLFADLEENTILSTNEPEIADLFDASPTTATGVSQTDEDLSNFWNQEAQVEPQPEFDIVGEPDVAKALEESLLAAAASGEIFSEIQQSIPSPTISFEQEDFDMTFLQLEEPQDLILSSNGKDNLFEELTTTNSTISPEVGDHNVYLPEIPSLSQEPEVLDFIPEFTNQPTENSLIDSPQVSAKLEIDLFDTIEGNKNEKTQILFEDIAVIDNSTYIQIETTENLLGNDLFISENTLDISLGENSDLQQFSTHPEFLNTNTNLEALTEFSETAELGLGDELFALSTELSSEDSHANLEALAEFSETTELSLGDELFASSTELSAEDINTNLEALAEFSETTKLGLGDELFAPSTELTVEDSHTNIDAIADFSATTIQFDVFEETADLSALLFDADVTSEAVPLAEKEDTTDIIAELGLTTAAVETAENIAPVAEVTLDEADISDEFADLEALLEEEVPQNTKANFIAEEDFAALEALLGTDNDEKATPTPASNHVQELRPEATNNTENNPVSSPNIGDEFGDLEKLLAEADKTISHSSPAKHHTSKTPRVSTRRTARFEETMKVPVKQLDDMSNLVGELVVNRNTLEQDHERLRQSLDNLLIQVQQLSDVGARMQELYERSLLEASLLASRKTKESPKQTNYHSPDADTDRGFSELEMDRFTPFHTLSQEMIELIVRVRESASDIDFVTEETERVARQFRQVTTQLQEGLTRARMVPFSQAIDRLRRGVRDNAIKYGKQVELIIEGGDTLIDKMILDHLTDPLTHMLNNAIAHGIETPEIRQAAGKPPVGVIAIRAFHQGNQTVISVGDDGAGIDTERVKSKAVKDGVITAEQAKTISRMEVYDLLFQSGFSIKDKADEISGRGVGMDVVRSEISEIRGTVNTDSTIGKGTTFTIRLPLTLSICKALCCVSDKARVAFPMDGVEDTLDIHVKNIQHSADGQSFISWRDTVLPFRPLKELLTFNRHIGRGGVYGGTRDDDMISVVVVRSGNTLIALQIDQVLSEQEIVIKQFEGPAPKPIGVAGATVLGDGRIMPIADVLEIIDIFQGRLAKQPGGTPWQQKAIPNVPEAPAVKIDPTVLIVDDSITVRELLSLTFNKAGYRVEQARDGQEAWDKLRSGLPCDIVFCDIEMPRCDGLELLSRIQKDSNLNHLPIAMLTSRGADKHRQMAIQLGASGYFTKPYLEEALLEAAVRMLKGEKLVSSS